MCPNERMWNRREDALHSARLAVNTAHERLDAHNKTKQIFGQQSSRGVDTQPSKADNLLDIGPTLDCFTATILCYCTLAAELERSGLGHLSLEWYERALHAAGKFQLDQSFTTELTKCIELAKGFMPQSPAPTAAGAAALSPRNSSIVHLTASGLLSPEHPDSGGRVGSSGPAQRSFNFYSPALAGSLESTGGDGLASLVGAGRGAAEGIPPRSPHAKARPGSALPLTSAKADTSDHSQQQPPPKLMRLNTAPATDSLFWSRSGKFDAEDLPDGEARDVSTNPVAIEIPTSIAVTQQKQPPPQQQQQYGSQGSGSVGGRARPHSALPRLVKRNGNDSGSSVTDGEHQTPLSGQQHSRDSYGNYYDAPPSGADYGYYSSNSNNNNNNNNIADARDAARDFRDSDSVDPGRVRPKSAISKLGGGYESPYSHLQAQTPSSPQHHTAHSVQSTAFLFFRGSADSADVDQRDAGIRPHSEGRPAEAVPGMMNSAERWIQNTSYGYSGSHGQAQQQQAQQRHSQSQSHSQRPMQNHNNHHQHDDGKPKQEQADARKRTPKPSRAIILMPPSSTTGRGGKRSGPAHTAPLPSGLLQPGKSALKKGKGRKSAKLAEVDKLIAAATSELQQLQGMKTRGMDRTALSASAQAQQMLFYSPASLPGQSIGRKVSPYRRQQQKRREAQKKLQRKEARRSSHNEEDEREEEDEEEGDENEDDDEDEEDAEGQQDAAAARGEGGHKKKALHHSVSEPVLNVGYEAKTGNHLQTTSKKVNTVRGTVAANQGQKHQRTSHNSDNNYKSASPSRGRARSRPDSSPATGRAGRSGRPGSPQHKQHLQGQQPQGQQPQGQQQQQQQQRIARQRPQSAAPLQGGSKDLRGSELRPTPPELSEAAKQKVQKIAEAFFPYIKGMRVEAKYLTGRLGARARWYPGRIVSANFTEGLYDVLFDNGEVEKGLYVDDIRMLDTPSMKRQAGGLRPASATAAGARPSVLPTARRGSPSRAGGGGVSGGVDGVGIATGIDGGAELPPAKEVRMQCREEMHTTALRVLTGVKQREQRRLSERLQLQSRGAVLLQALWRGAFVRMKEPQIRLAVLREKELRLRERALADKEQKMLEHYQQLIAQAQEIAQASQASPELQQQVRVQFEAAKRASERSSTLVGAGAGAATPLRKGVAAPTSHASSTLLDLESSSETFASAAVLTSSAAAGGSSKKGPKASAVAALKRKDIKGIRDDIKTLHQEQQRLFELEVDRQRQMEGRYEAMLRELLQSREEIARVKQEVHRSDTSRHLHVSDLERKIEELLRDPRPTALAYSNTAVAGTPGVVPTERGMQRGVQGGHHSHSHRLHEVEDGALSPLSGGPLDGGDDEEDGGDGQGAEEGGAVDEEEQRERMNSRPAAYLEDGTIELPELSRGDVFDISQHSSANAAPAKGGGVDGPVPCSPRLDPSPLPSARSGKVSLRTVDDVDNTGEEDLKLLRSIDDFPMMLRSTDAVPFPLEQKSHEQSVHIEEEPAAISATSALLPGTGFGVAGPGEPSHHEEIDEASLPNLSVEEELMNLALGPPCDDDDYQPSASTEVRKLTAVATASVALSMGTALYVAGNAIDAARSAAAAIGISHSLSSTATTAGQVKPIPAPERRVSHSMRKLSLSERGFNERPPVDHNRSGPLPASPAHRADRPSFTAAAVPVEEQEQSLRGLSPMALERYISHPSFEAASSPAAAMPTERRRSLAAALPTGEDPDARMESSKSISTAPSDHARSFAEPSSPKQGADSLALPATSAEPLHEEEVLDAGMTPRALERFMSNPNFDSQNQRKQALVMGEDIDGGDSNASTPVVQGVHYHHHHQHVTAEEIDEENLSGMPSAVIDDYMQHPSFRKTDAGVDAEASDADELDVGIGVTSIESAEDTDQAQPAESAAPVNTRRPPRVSGVPAPVAGAAIPASDSSYNAEVEVKRAKNLVQPQMSELTMDPSLTNDSSTGADALGQSQPASVSGAAMVAEMEGIVENEDPSPNSFNYADINPDVVSIDVLEADIDRVPTPSTTALALTVACAATEEVTLCYTSRSAASSSTTHGDEVKIAPKTTYHVEGMLRSVFFIPEVLCNSNNNSKGAGGNDGAHGHRQQSYAVRLVVKSAQTGREELNILFDQQRLEKLSKSLQWEKFKRDAGHRNAGEDGRGSAEEKALSPYSTICSVRGSTIQMDNVLKLVVELWDSFVNWSVQSMLIYSALVELTGEVMMEIQGAAVKKQLSRINRRFSSAFMDPSLLAKAVEYSEGGSPYTVGGNTPIPASSSADLTQGDDPRAWQDDFADVLQTGRALFMDFKQKLRYKEGGLGIELMHWQFDVRKMMDDIDWDDISTSNLPENILAENFQSVANMVHEQLSAFSTEYDPDVPNTPAAAVAAVAAVAAAFAEESTKCDPIGMDADSGTTGVRKTATMETLGTLGSGVTGVGGQKVTPRRARCSNLRNPLGSGAVPRSHLSRTWERAFEQLLRHLRGFLRSEQLEQLCTAEEVEYLSRTCCTSFALSLQHFKDHNWSGWWKLRNRCEDLIGKGTMDEILKEAEDVMFGDVYRSATMDSYFNELGEGEGEGGSPGGDMANFMQLVAAAAKRVDHAKFLKYRNEEREAIAKAHV